MVLANAIETPVEFGQRLKDLDPDALTQLYKDVFDDVYRFVSGRVVDRDQTEDLVQDIFLSLYRALPSYDVTRPLKPWVMTIARNKLRDRWRQQGRRGALVDVDEIGEPVSREGAPDTSLERSEFADEVERAVSLLPESMRSVVDLRLREGLSFNQIGDALDTTPVAVRKRFSRGVSLLRTRIREAG
jgi:RNA polymerase sigma-70 factor (ECF subfamily)